jgi:hypothetical protein
VWLYTTVWDSELDASRDTGRYSAAKDVAEAWRPVGEQPAVRASLLSRIFEVLTWATGA